jgi:hypothetical protein
MPPLFERSDGQHLGGGDDPLSAAPVNPDLKHAVAFRFFSL